MTRIKPLPAYVTNTYVVVPDESWLNGKSVSILEGRAEFEPTHDGATLRGVWWGDMYVAIDYLYENFDYSVNITTPEIVYESTADTILEPVMHVVVIVPETWIGGVMADLLRRGALFEATEEAGEGQKRICSQVPLSQLRNLSKTMKRYTVSASATTFYYQPGKGYEVCIAITTGDEQRWPPEDPHDVRCGLSTQQRPARKELH